MKCREMNKKAAGFVQEHLGEILISLVIIAILLTGFFMLKNKDIGWIKAIENFFRYRA